MSDPAAFPFESDPAPHPGVDPHALVVDLEGYEGPIDVLLTLVRDQKLDLTRISILALADQYLAFIARVRDIRLEVAADYLVMAAWLAYLKSRLLLPAPTTPGAEPTAAEMADALAFQLQRLQAMQDAGVRLMARPQLGRDVFARGAPEGLPVVQRPRYEATVYDFLSAYGAQIGRAERRRLDILPSELYSMEMAIERLSAMLGRMPDWVTLSSFLPPGLGDTLVGRSAQAAMLAAGLELVRSGRLHIRQDRPFGPIYIRKASENPVTELPGADRQERQ